MIRLAVSCPRERADAVLAELVELVPAGVEQVERHDVTEFAIYGAPGELPDFGGARAEVAGIEVGIHAAEIADGWAERWKQFHEPVEIGDRLRIRPPWAESIAGVEEIVIDPGRAFGTGAHPSTRMCCELLLELAQREGARGSIADLGAGSGVLSILAARLGFSPVVGIDSEISALEAARRNAAANGAEIELQRLDLRRLPPPEASTVTANLTAELLVTVARYCRDRVSPPRHAICSGVLVEQVGSVEDAFAAAGLATRKQLRAGEWAALLLGR